MADHHVGRALGRIERRRPVSATSVTRAPRSVKRRARMPAAPSTKTTSRPPTGPSASRAAGSCPRRPGRRARCSASPASKVMGRSATGREYGRMTGASAAVRVARSTIPDRAETRCRPGRHAPGPARSAPPIAGSVDRLEGPAPAGRSRQPRDRTSRSIGSPPALTATTRRVGIEPPLDRDRRPVGPDQPVDPWRTAGSAARRSEQGPDERAQVAVPACPVPREGPRQAGSLPPVSPISSP